MYLAWDEGEEEKEKKWGGWKRKGRERSRAIEERKRKTVGQYKTVF